LGSLVNGQRDGRKLAVNCGQMKQAFNQRLTVIWALASKLDDVSSVLVLWSPLVGKRDANDDQTFLSSATSLSECQKGRIKSFSILQWEKKGG